MNIPLSNDYFSHLLIDDKFTRELPADPSEENSRRQVERACYSYVMPTQVSAPQLLAFSHDVAESLGFTEEFCQSETFLQIFSGNRLIPGTRPYAMNYGGHQFGNWAGQLGDGRAINLGEIVNVQKQRWVLQLKGAGPTPYSRMADGLAVLRSSIREFLCSEAMHHLGVPTTRALSLVTTGELVERDMFYDGHPKKEPGAIVCRVSPSFIRFGNFEIFSARGEIEQLQRLVDYTIATDYPDLGSPNKEVYLEWIAEISRRTAIMVSHWMRVGFVHGVMNTDNMSILGLTIDYGPYGWVEDYNPTWTPNTTDAQGRRYCFANQPHIAQWNLVQLANAVYPLIKDRKGMETALDVYRSTFQREWANSIAQKLGLTAFEEHVDDTLANDLLGLLTQVETDMTIFFRKLGDVERDNEQQCREPLSSPFFEAYYQPDQLGEEYWRKMKDWLSRYRKRLSRDHLTDGDRRRRMNRVNPQYVMRNYLAQLAIDKAEQGDESLVNELLEVMRKPYDEQPGKEKFREKRPEWARHRPGCSMLSCSS